MSDTNTKPIQSVLYTCRHFSHIIASPHNHFQKQFIERDALMSRANSLKKAVREIIEHTERAVDDQNEQTATRQPLPIITFEPSDDVEMTDNRRTGKGLQVQNANSMN